MIARGGVILIMINLRGGPLEQFTHANGGCAVRRFLLAGLGLSLVVAGCKPPPIPPNQSLTSAALDYDAALRGQSFVEGSCASCHAVGPTGASPFADATPFRDIVTRYPLSDLEEGFAEGLVTAHPAMPDYVFRASEIDDLIAYLQALKDMEARP